jgi:hypothetical protein
MRFEKHGTYWTAQRDKEFRLYGVAKASGSSAAHQEYSINMEGDS